MNRKFAKLKNGSISFAPAFLRGGFGVISNPSEQDYREAGYLPVIEDPPTVGDGEQAIRTGWEEKDGNIYAVYDVRPIPKQPRIFSRYDISSELHKMGLYDQVMQFLSENGMMWAWNDATVFEEDNEFFKQGIALAKEKFGVTDEQVEEVLSKCIYKSVY